MPIFNWSADDLPIRWQSKRELAAELTVLRRHYETQRDMLQAHVAYIDTLENAAESDLDAFNDVVKAEMALAAEATRLRSALLTMCDIADVKRAPEGRAGRVGTQAIRALFA